MAHETLVAAWKACRDSEGEVFEQLRDALILLHSYILIKPLVRINDHEVHFCFPQHAPL